jgi:type II secretory pathway component PulC
MNRTLLVSIAARCRKPLPVVLRYAPRVAGAALALLVVAQLRWLGLALAPIIDDYRAAPPPAGAKPPQPVSLAGLASAHLFGEAPVPVAVPTAPPAPVADPAPAPTALALTGTLLDELRVASQAIIADGRDERGYRLGDTLATGGRLHAVFADHVTLERDGQFETLRVRDWNSLGGAPAAVAAAPLPQAQYAAADAPPAGSASGGVDAAALLKARETPFTRAFQLSMHDDGDVAGLMVNAGRDKRTLGQLGLVDGDIITSVDGHRVRNGGALLSALQSSRPVKLSVVRGGARQVVTISGSIFANQFAQR